MAGVAGFEPAHDGIKTRCLTAWLYPNNVLLMKRSLREFVANFKLHLAFEVQERD